MKAIGPSLSLLKRGSRKLMERRTSRTWAAICVAFVMVATGYAVWRGRSLDGIPDVGDPFDVERAWAGVEIPDDENAYVLYAKAHGLLVIPRGIASDEWGDEWEQASSAVRNAVIGNRAALAVWREASERPRALYHQTRATSMNTVLPLVQDLNLFSRLAVLEGSRLEAKGDMAEAWEWYRVTLRSSRHAGHGFLIQQLVGAAIHKRVSAKIVRWAHDPRVGPELLRSALREVQLIDSMSAPVSEALKRDYFVMMRDIDEMKYLVDELPTPLGSPDAIRGRPVLAQGVGYLQRARVMAHNDRERSRRIFKMLYANWLAQCDKPVSQRAPIAVTAPVVIYGPDPSAPAAARALAPDALARALESSLLAKQASMGGIKSAPWELDGALAQERARQAALVVTLAEELYQRDHGKPPRTPQELVGPYLNALPEGYARTPVAAVPVSSDNK